MPADERREPLHLRARLVLTGEMLPQQDSSIEWEWDLEVGPGDIVHLAAVAPPGPTDREGWPEAVVHLRRSAVVPREQSALGRKHFSVSRSE